MNVYFISGLAADRRVFKHIRLPNGFTMIHLDWIPALKGETLVNYASRLATPINRSEPFILVGLSMGGMVATEIAKQYSPTATILLSSIATHQHLPTHLKLAGKLKLHRIVPVKLVKNAAILKRFFTTETPDDKTTLKQIIRESDSRFIYWAMDAILKWRNEEVPQPLFHLHGTRDEILPIKYTKPTHVIPKAGHLMVMNRASQVNEFLTGILKRYQPKPERQHFISAFGG
jgi:pimeloyl-ACP methyl ester carboxylesterase